MEGIRQYSVEAWFAAEIAGAQLPLRFERIPGGHSNLTFRVVDAAGRQYVLRRPPLGSVLESAHDVARECRILAALLPTDVPVPPVRALCTDPGVNGAPFYVMDFVVGSVLHDSSAGRSVPEAARRALGFELIDVLARIHAVSLDATGLVSLGRREDYIARQLRRWSRQYEAARVRDLPALTRAGALLQSAIPFQKEATLVHGDYRLGNCIVAGEPRIAAVLDWELCTLGEPLADLGYLLNTWLAPAEIDPALGDLSPSAAGGFPSREELTAHYAAATGRDVSHIDYYRAFSYWRSAAINEGVYARYLNGAMGASTVDLARYEAGGRRYAEQALALVERL